MPFWVYRVREIVELVFNTIREPISIVPLPLALARLLAIPREKLFKSVRTTHTLIHAKCMHAACVF